MTQVLLYFLKYDPVFLKDSALLMLVAYRHKQIKADRVGGKNEGICCFQHFEFLVYSSKVLQSNNKDSL